MGGLRLILGSRRPNAQLNYLCLFLALRFVSLLHVGSRLSGGLRRPREGGGRYNFRVRIVSLELVQLRVEEFALNQGWAAESLQLQGCGCLLALTQGNGLNFFGLEGASDDGRGFLVRIGDGCQEVALIRGGKLIDLLLNEGV